MLPNKTSEYRQKIVNILSSFREGKIDISTALDRILVIAFDEQERFYYAGVIDERKEQGDVIAFLKMEDIKALDAGLMVPILQSFFFNDPMGGARKINSNLVIQKV